MKIGKGAVVRDSILMSGVVIGDGTVVDKAIIADNVTVGSNVRLGCGNYAESKLNPKVYAFDLVTVGEDSSIPDNVSIGRNTAISGITEAADYPDGSLESGDYIIKAGGEK